MGKRLTMARTWSCAQTGDCCHGDVRVSHDEALLLRAQWRSATKPVVLEPLESGFWLLRGGPCPFLTADQQCAVYEVRPYVCRRFVCYRAAGEVFDPSGDLGCANLSQRLTIREYRKDYARRQQDAQRWALTHGWTGREG